MIYWIWLQKALGLGSNRLHSIMEKFGGAQQVYSADNITRECSGIFSERELRMMSTTPLEYAKTVYNDCIRENVTVITPDTDAYPKILKNIPNPPLVLYVKGRFPDFDATPAFCVIGTRKINDYISKCAYSLAGRLAAAGFIIVSGGAKGSDAEAHNGVLKNGGITVGILANGFGDNYLAQNEALRKEIMNNGCLITECPPFTPIVQGAFHRRNRIMSGLCHGVAIVSAGEISGTIITAKCAVEQGRDVFVIPGSPSQELYKGSNKLISDGAIPLLNIDDILSEYTVRLNGKIDAVKAKSIRLAKWERYIPKIAKNNIAVTTKTAPNKTVNTKEEKIFKKILPEHLSKNAKIIYNQLDKQIFTCDSLLNPDMNSSDVLAALGELELMGFVKSLPGGRYTLS